MTRPSVRKRNRPPKYSSAPLAVVPDDADLGERMRKLTVKQRRFVIELHCGPCGYGSEVRAARAAGYGTATSSDLALRVEAHRVLHNPKVQAALREVGGKIIRAEAFQSIRTTVEIARDKTHKDCLKANIALMDRGGFAIETHHTVTVQRTPEMIAVDAEKIIERIRELTAKLGLEPVKLIEVAPVAEEAPPS